MDVYEVRLAPVYMESSGERLGKATLRRFQSRLVEVREGAVLLTAPTGSGKTVALLTDVERGVSVGLYPNNELVCSQITGLHRFITEHLSMRPAYTGLLEYCVSNEAEGHRGYPLNEYVAEEPVDFFSERKVSKLYVVGMGGRLVRVLGEKGKIGVLVEAVAKKLGRIRRQKLEYAIVVGTPDTFFLLSLYIYRNLEDVGKLLGILIKSWSAPLDVLNRELMRQGFARDRLATITSVLLPLLDSTIFVDEYHLYGLYELSSLRVLAWALKHIHEWSGRIVFSSATPRREVAEEVASVLGLQLTELNAISHVKESGDESELVRGPTKLVFIGVDTDSNSYIGRLYRSSEKAHVLVDTPDFSNFVNTYKAGVGRGMVILEKVYHAELFARTVLGKHGVKPVCAYSMASGGLCDEGTGYADSGRLLVVGTGAKIGQGVEYTRVSFGVVARVTTPDLLQSIGRIGRRLSDESTVLIPIDESLLTGRNGVAKNLKHKMTYRELAEWAENNAKPYLKAVPEGYRELYAGAMTVREELLKLAGLALYYRHTDTYSKAYNTVNRAVLSNLVTLAPADKLYEVAMFRSTGPTVSYCREDSCTCMKEDLGTIVRNFEVKSVNGKLAITSGGRGELRVLCKKELKLKSTINANKGKTMLASWSVLMDMFGCIIADAEGERATELERELGDTFFLVIQVKDKDFASYISRTGKGLIIEMDAGTTGIALLYI